LTGLYVHVPFCESKCPYCAFASAVKERGDEERYLEALLAEISFRRRGDLAPETVYVGGGTPTTLSAAAWLRLSAALRPFLPAPGGEVTVEANPGALSKEHLKLWRGWVSRISLGVQSFDDRELSFLGRVHDARQAADAALMCKSAGFELSLDLMFGLPGQTLRDWAGTLSRAVSLGVSHISVYQLSLEPGAPFSEKNLLLPDGYRPYRYAQWYLTRKGYGQYEVASFARPGCESAHNLNYWDDGEYLGLGPSAWSCLGGTRSQNAPSLGEYCRLLRERGSAVVYEERLAPGPAARQAAILALRATRGIDWRKFEEKHGEVFKDEVKKKLQRFPEYLVRVGDSSASLTPRGLRVANRIWEEII
jgi:oxygen-independent coproporphyrinogen-3 oxidase